MNERRLKIHHKIAMRVEQSGLNDKDNWMVESNIEEMNKYFAVFIQMYKVVYLP